MLARNTTVHMIKTLPQRGKLNLGAAFDALNADLTSSRSDGESNLEDLTSDASLLSSVIAPEINLRKQRGQVILEYVILLGMGVTIGIIILNNLFGSADDKKGFRLAWACLIEAIGTDVPGKPNSAKGGADCR